MPVSGGGPTTIDQLETAIGRTLDYSLHYEYLAETFPNAAEMADAASGRTPMISLHCGVAADIGSGTLDAQIDARATAYAAFGKPVLLRYCWEMNLQMRGVTPTDFVAAWKRMHDRTIARGANNVLWFFCPSHGTGLAYYPGDAYVDYAGWDAYDDRGAGLAATMGPPYSAYTSINKPFIVGETGAMASLNQATYLDGSSRALLTGQFPKIVGITYFDASGAVDWSLSPAGLAAFKAFALSK